MIHLIQNDPEVPPGLVAEELDRLQQPWALHHPFRGEALPSPADMTALIVMGGAMGADDDARHPFLTPLKGLIREVVEREIPYLGICLGGQLLAASLGARVASNRWEELGTLEVTLAEAGLEDPLFKGIERVFTTFQWHHDSFDLPEGARLLAGSQACPHQAFAIGPRAWGVQFHPEVTGAIIRDWCAWDPETAAQTEGLVTKWRSQEEPYRAVMRRLMENFRDCC